ncbi:hypothetical protein XELAEV_18017287mg [Xenopus laevis]|uniref:ADP-ribosylation factor-like protein 10 n=1 Tax=Xenopus laevis TaxID=8355 RepID=A0A974DAY1_XENLA|nr:hypothetical protein XELAEV_18017287mg [Xenopus laevis]
MAALRSLIGAAVAALGSVLFIAWSRFFPVQRRRRRYLECSPATEQVKYLDRQILVLGLDGAGKSSIIHALSTDTTRSSSAPTHGFNSAQILHQGLRIELLEVGGSHNLRTYWKQYLKNAHIIVFVVDSTDSRRIHLARQELHQLLHEEPDLPLMVLANKQDRTTALCLPEIHSELSLHRITSEREVTLLGTSAISDGAAHSTRLQTVKTLLEERLQSLKGTAQNGSNHPQTTQCHTSLQRDG